MNSLVLRRAIVLSWTVLVVCFILKALGGDWFSITVSSTWLEEHPWVAVLAGALSNYLLFTLYYLAICEVTRFKAWIHISLFPYFFLVSCLKMFLVPSNFYIVLDLVSNFVIPALLIIEQKGRPKKEHIRAYFRILSAFAFNCGFQSISALVRGISAAGVIDSLLVQFIMSIDVLIMLLLYWLYSLYNKMEEEKMGFVFTFLLGKNKEELTAILDGVNAQLKDCPGNSFLQKEKMEVEKRIAELEESES